MAGRCISSCIMICQLNFQLILKTETNSNVESGMDIPLIIIIRLLKEFAGAIHFLHSKLKKKKPIVHCDLKPRNLLLTMEMHLKISDLGSAARCSTTEHIPNDEDEDSLYITHRYCAPELFRCNLNERLLPQVDIYSFGIILWEIMVREEPYRYANGGDFIQHAVKNHANRPSLEDELQEKGLSEEQIKSLRTVCPLAWHHTPDERPSSEQLVALLEVNFPFSHKCAFSQAHEIAKELPHCSDSNQYATEPLSKLIDQHMKGIITTDGAPEWSASVVQEDSSLDETHLKYVSDELCLDPLHDNFNVGATEDSNINLSTENLEIDVASSFLEGSNLEPSRPSHLYRAVSCFSLGAEHITFEDICTSEESLLYTPTVANDKPLYINISRLEMGPRSLSFLGDIRESMQPSTSVRPQRLENRQAASPTRCLMLGAKKVGKHAIVNLYKRMLLKKRLKNERHNEFIFHLIKDYHRFLPTIDVVMLCFAADNKKSLDQMKSIWQDLSPTRNMENVPIVVVMTSPGKRGCISIGNLHNAEQYSASIGAKICPISVTNILDIQRVFDLAQQVQFLAKQRPVKLSVPSYETP